MFWWGLRDKAVVLETGTFYCPHCNQDADYVLEEVRHYLTVYSIPIVALHAKERYVECQECETHYRPSMVQDTTELDEVQNSRWDYVLGGVAVFCTLYFFMYVPSMVYDFFMYKPQTPAITSYGVSYTNPMKVYVGNDTDEEQTVRVTSNGDVGVIKVNKKSLVDFNIYKSGTITVSCGKESEDLTIDDPEMAYFVHIDEQKKLHLKYGKPEKPRPEPCKDVFKSYLYRYLS